MGTLTALGEFCLNLHVYAAFIAAPSSISCPEDFSTVTEVGTPHLS